MRNTPCGQLFPCVTHVPSWGSDTSVSDVKVSNTIPRSSVLKGHYPVQSSPKVGEEGWDWAKESPRRGPILELFIRDIFWHFFCCGLSAKSNLLFSEQWAERHLREDALFSPYMEVRLCHNNGRALHKDELSCAPSRPKRIQPTVQPYRLLGPVPWTGFSGGATPCSPPACSRSSSDSSDTP